MDKNPENWKIVQKSKFLSDFVKYRYLLTEIVRRNIKVQYRDSVLGIFWTLLQPLLTTVVLALVFGGFFGKSADGISNYVIYLLCGRLLYDFFSQSTKRAMKSVRLSAGVIKKVYVPKYMYPLGNVISCFITFLISLIILVGFLVGYSFTDKAVPITPYILLSVVPIAVLFILCVGVGMILSTAAVFFKDAEYLYDVFCMLLFYATPIVYVINNMNMNKYVQLGIKANPLYSIISMFRDCVLNGCMFNLNHLWYSLAFSVICVLIGALMFKKKQDKFILHI
ncbi:MAG: ABC transporter permease [Clostridia bacterium]|nr:ABC transporter permease [Clostridia bacterium]